MNRRHRRRQRRRNGVTPDMIAATRCPDCDSETAMVEHAPGVWLAEVCHDDTCPWFRDYQAKL